MMAITDLAPLSINAGKTDGPLPMTWHQHDGDRFHTDVMGSYSRYLAHTKGTHRHHVHALLLLIRYHYGEYKDRLANMGMSCPSLLSMPPTASHNATPSDASSASTPIQSSLGLEVDGRSKASSAEKAAAPKKRSRGAKKAGRRSGDDWDAMEETEEEEEFDEDGEDEDEEDQLRSDWGIDETQGQRDNKGEDEEDEEEDSDEEDEDEDENNGAPPPDADELGLNDAVKEELAALSPKARRRRLIHISRMSDYERRGVCMRAHNQAVMRQIDANFGILPKKPKPAPRPVRREGQPTGPPRRSSRLNPAGEDTGATSANEENTTAMPRGGENTDLATAGEEDATATLRDVENTIAASANEENATATPRSGENTDSAEKDATATLRGRENTTCTGTNQENTTTTPRGSENTDSATAGEENATATLRGIENTTAASVNKENATTTPRSAINSDLAEDDATATLHGSENMDPTTVDELNSSTTTRGGRNTAATTPAHETSTSGLTSAQTVVPAAIIDRTNWPAWVTEGYEFLSERNYGDNFERAVGWWTALERVYGWQTSVRCTRFDSLL